jgi:hypothetical protein
MITIIIPKRNPHDIKDIVCISDNVSVELVPAKTAKEQESEYNSNRYKEESKE